MADSGLCDRCGAPRPRGEPDTCAYCGVTQGQLPQISPAELAERRLRVVEAFKGSLANGADAELAISIAAREHLGPLGETDALSAVVLALARRFQQQGGIDITRDAIAMSRILEGYLKAIEEMRHQGYSELNLPFLAADAKGPQHLALRLDPAVARALLAAPAKKQGWWPFS